MTRNLIDGLVFMAFWLVVVAWLFVIYAVLHG